MLSKLTPTLLAAVFATGCATTETPPSPTPEGALTSYELLSLMSEATLSGNSTSTNGATFSQTYPKIPKRSNKGKTEGTWNPPGDSPSSYKISWKIRGDQWCEKWDSGSACWHIVPISGNDYQFYKDGVALSEVWQIQSPNPGPLRLTPAQIEKYLTKNQINAGEWQYKGAGGNQSGTFVTHACADGSRYASSDNKPFYKSKWFFKKNKMCSINHEGKERCYAVWQHADGTYTTFRKTESGQVTSVSTVQGASGKCSA
ncbi:MAG: hypothetical protein KTR18_03005 [Acidiferrobacterales bacterium]|nr:hypothetical protein [Acidiferrobacterales bacterium]